MHATEHASHDRSYRSLWVATVMLALEDILTQPYDSIHYNVSVSLFTARGEWAVWRSELAGYIDLHADDLKKAGLAHIAARHAEEPPALTPAAQVLTRPGREVIHRAPHPDASTLPPAMRVPSQTPPTPASALVEVDEHVTLQPSEIRAQQIQWFEQPERVPFNPMINRKPRPPTDRYGYG